MFEKSSMAPKFAKTKGDSKYKGKATTSSIDTETDLSLVSADCVKEFEEKHQHRLVMKAICLETSGCWMLGYSCCCSACRASEN